MRQTRGKLICPNCGSTMLYTGEDLVEVRDRTEDGELSVEAHNWRVFECSCGCEAHLSIPAWRAEQLRDLEQYDEDAPAEMDKAC